MNWLCAWEGVWTDLQAGALEAEWVVGSASVQVTALAADVPRRRLACGLWSGGVSMWDLRERPAPGAGLLARHQRAITAIVFCGEHAVATASQDSFVNVWDVRRAAAPACSVSIDHAAVLALAGVAGTRALAASTPKALYVLDTATGAAAPVDRAHAPGFGSLLWNAAAGQLYACSQSSVCVFAPRPPVH